MRNVHLRFVIFFLFGICLTVRAQTEFRKHFIITIDKQVLQYASVGQVSHLLSDILSSRYPTHNDYKRIEEARTGVSVVEEPLFDPYRDEISVYCPGIQLHEIPLLVSGVSPHVNSHTFARFADHTATLLMPHWSLLNQQSRTSSQLNNYFARISSSMNTITGIAYSLPSTLSIPMVLTVVARQSNVAEQYILISVSSYNQNPVSSQQLLAVLPQLNDTGSKIVGHFNRIPFLNQQLSFGNHGAYINADAIIPINPESGEIIASPFFSDPLVFKQKKPGSTQFIMRENYLNINQPENLYPTALRFKILSEAHEIWSGVLASRSDIYENWNSTYSSSDRMMSYNVQGNQYFIPEIDYLTFNEQILQNDQDFSLILDLIAFYELIPELNFKIILRSHSILTSENIFIARPGDKVAKYSFIPIILVILSVLYLIYRGRPLEIRYIINGHIDSFEKISNGKRMTPYKFWDTPEDNILVNCEVVFRSENYIFNWNPVVYAEIENIRGIPDKFDVTIRRGFTAYEEFHSGSTLTIKTDKTHKFDLIINVRNTDTLTNKIADPTIISIPLKLYIREKRLLINSAARDKFFTYSFHVGPDLKDFWVGFDAGTSSTCVAIGTSDKIRMGRTRNGDYIIPSRLSIDLNEEPSGEQIRDLEFPDSIVRYGTAAESRFNIATDEKFQSIKKLLGYKDVKRIVFRNSLTADLSGSKLTSLLVRKIFRDIKETIEGDTVEYKSILEKGKFDPKRLVVAIPNNFSQSKINDLLEAFTYLKKPDPDSQQMMPQFIEVRYVYEAEAIVMYYLKNSNSVKKILVPFDEEGIVTPSKKVSGLENVMVFDMGGATINATLVSVKQLDSGFETSYDVNIVGKIGYGIGGDTIDYCLLKFLFSFTDDYPVLKTLDPLSKKPNSQDTDEIRNNRDLRLQYQQIAFSIKKLIIQNFSKNEKALITAAELNDLFGGRVRFTTEDKIIQYFQRTKEGTYPLFEHEIFQRLIYGNISDATTEILNLSAGLKIDTLIFSGRSTFFPLIRDHVIIHLKKALKQDLAVVDLPIEESKTAVAQGACLYGLNKGGITLNNVKTPGTFGVAKYNSMDQNDVDFIKFIDIGLPFKQNSEELRYLETAKVHESDFRFSNGEVKFMQVMGKEADSILKNRENHKINQIGKIRIDMKSKLIYMYINESDEVRCRVKTISDRVYDLTEFVSDQEIADANDEHYTWILQ